MSFPSSSDATAYRNTSDGATDSSSATASYGQLQSAAPRPVQPVQPTRLSAVPRLSPSKVDLTTDAALVADELRQAKGKTLVGGISALARLKFEAWLEERMQGPILRKLEVRKAVAEAHKTAEVAQNSVRGAVHDGNKNEEQHGIELSQLRSQRLMADLEQYVAMNLPPETLLATASGNILPSAPSANPGMLPSAGSAYSNPSAPSFDLSVNASVAAPAAVHISGGQIEALALRAAMQLGPQGEEGDDLWPEYRQQLFAQLPPHIASEVERRVQELRALLG